MARRAVISLAIVCLIGVVVIAVAPAVGRWYIENRLLPSLGRSIGRTVSVSEVSVRLGQLTLRGLDIRGPADGERPAIAIPEVQARFATMSLLSGPVRVARLLLLRPRINLLRLEDGKSNFVDLVRRGGGKGSGSGGRITVDAVDLRSGSLVVDDRMESAKVEVKSVDGTLVRGGRSSVRLGGVRITSPRVPSALLFTEVAVTGRLRRGSRELPRVRVAGGEVQLLPRLRLTGIRGTVTPASGGGRIDIDLQGSYGGAETRLWSATGWVSRTAQSGSLRVRAARFSLGRIASILGRTPVILPQRTMIDGRMDLRYKDRRLTLGGKLGLERLSLFHPRLAGVPVLDLSGVGEVEGEIDLRRKRLALSKLTLTSRGVELRLSGDVDWSGKAPHLSGRLVVPLVACQQVLEAFPPSLVPALQGFELRGKFSLDLHADVDFARLERLDLGGKVGIRRCKVVKAPEEVGADRMEGGFEQQVEPTPQQHVVFTVGPENESFAPYASISPNVVNAFLTTEDGGFFRHRGFIPSMFEKALSRNLKRGGFRLGASTITMQMVKNVLLTHDKTLSRKLQELFLTWYLEQELSKQRIMEIYLNVIEFGPGIYGIGPAAWHYFGKLPAEVSPLEAAFFASILPSPKRRYVQYCRGTLTDKWDRYVRRILRRMVSKEFVSEQAQKEAQSQSLTFNRDLEELPVKDCLDQVKELVETWREERVRRFRTTILRSAPHQVDLYLPKPVR